MEKKDKLKIFWEYLNNGNYYVGNDLVQLYKMLQQEGEDGVLPSTIVNEAMQSLEIGTFASIVLASSLDTIDKKTKQWVELFNLLHTNSEDYDERAVLWDLIEAL